MVVLAVLAVVYVVPVILASGCIFRYQFAGFFPKYESTSCITIGSGTSVGPNSFHSGAWTTPTACAAPS